MGPSRAPRVLPVTASLAGVLATSYILLSPGAYSLLIGAGLLFAALAAIMYLTRNIDLGGLRPADPA